MTSQPDSVWTTSSGSLSPLSRRPSPHCPAAPGTSAWWRSAVPATCWPRRLSLQCNRSHGRRSASPQTDLRRRSPSLPKDKVDTFTTQQEDPGFSLDSTSSKICMWRWIGISKLSLGVWCVYVSAYCCLSFFTSLCISVMNLWLVQNITLPWPYDSWQGLRQNLTTRTQLINFNLLVAARSIHSRGGSENLGITLNLWEIATLQSHCISLDFGRKSLLHDVK